MEILILLCVLILLINLWHVSLFLNSWASKPKIVTQTTTIVTPINKKLSPNDAKLLTSKPKYDKIGKVIPFKKRDKNDT